MIFDNDSISQAAFCSVIRGKMAFCQYITWPDLFSLPKYPDELIISDVAWPLIFAERAALHKHLEHDVHILWQGKTVREHKFVWRGGKVHHCFLTKFSGITAMCNDDLIGSLFVLVKTDNHAYQGWILTTDDEIDDFLLMFNMSPADTNCLLRTVFHL
ncbi:MAG: hypothetical protein II145_03285 [Selenomonas sp.]|nr:hypothetical protein [Selenomonas sp.]